MTWPVSRTTLIAGVLVVAIVASAVGVVAAKHDTRTLFTSLQKERAQRDQLAARHAQLELEYSTWANVERIRRIGRKSLDMQPPTNYRVLRGGS